MRVRLLGIPAAILLFATPILADDAYDLSPRAQVGQKWECSLDCGVRIKNSQVAGGTFSTPGITETTRKFTTTVAEAVDGKWTKLEIEYGKCQIKNQTPGAPTAEITIDPLSQKLLTVSRRVEAGVPEAKVEIDEHGLALPVTLEDDLQADFSLDIMPAKPVKIGQGWTTDKVGALFGANTDGKVNLTLQKIETARDGHKRAVVAVKGSAVQRFGPTAEGRDRHQVEGKVEMTIAYGFRGTLLVNLATGLKERVTLNGEVDLEHAAGLGQSMRSHGTMIYDVVCTPQASVVAENANLAQPAVPTSLAGTYRNEKVTLNLTDDHGQYVGTITMGDKKYPLKAKADGTTLTGTFNSDGDPFNFTGKIDADTLTLKTGTSDYVLKREQARNPPGEEHPGNPLGTDHPRNPLGGENQPPAPRNPLAQ